MRIQLIETTGEGKSAVATPDGKSRKKKKLSTLFRYILNTTVGPMHKFVALSCIITHSKYFS